MRKFPHSPDPVLQQHGPSILPGGFAAGRGGGGGGVGGGAATAPGDRTGAAQATRAGLSRAPALHRISAWFKLSLLSPFTVSPFAHLRPLHRLSGGRRARAGSCGSRRIDTPLLRQRTAAAIVPCRHRQLRVGWCVNDGEIEILEHNRSNLRVWPAAVEGTVRGAKGVRRCDCAGSPCAVCAAGHLSPSPLSVCCTHSRKALLRDLGVSRGPRW